MSEEPHQTPSFIWLDRRIVEAIHSEQLVEHGGSPGIRDEGLLESALARPEMKANYGETSPAVLAAAYAFGIARNHPFIDGNKRTAFVAMELFLAKNGFALTATDSEAVTTFLALAAGELSEDELAAWIGERMEPGSA